MERITSLKNPKVMMWRALKERKGRQETGLFLVEGRKLVGEALGSDFPVAQLLVAEGYHGEFDLPENVPVTALPEHVLAAVCDTKTPQGIAAVVGMRDAPMTGKRLVALDGVQDPGNVGTIIRTADAAGFDGVLLSGQCADVYSPKVLRATMGSLFHVPVRVTGDLPGALRALRAEGFRVLSSQLDGAPFADAARACRGALCLVIGNEGNGVSEDVQAVADVKVRLPMRGRAESLNAAVAAGIMMYGLME